MTLSELFDKADELVEKRFAYSNATINEMNEYRDGYIHGMTEKLEGMIPLEKACEWIKTEVLEDYAGIIWENIIDDFRKAMEE